jgi:hypothetical protein
VVGQVLRRIMPAGVEAPSSFESVGHVAHLNLRPEALPVKHLIGQVRGNPGGGGRGEGAGWVAGWHAQVQRDRLMCVCPDL